MTLDEWLERWRISPQCLAELQVILNAPTVTLETGSVTGRGTFSEAQVQQDIRLEASRRGIRLWRNNLGACIDQNDRHIRYGLANDSQKMNKEIKSSDLIGITPIIIKPEDVGRLIGQFTSIEVKKYPWKYTGTPREVAQLKWLNLVNSLGGLARFLNNAEDL